MNHSGDQEDYCEFCDQEKIRSERREENELCVFLQKPQEILIGSGIIIPKAHRRTLFDLSAEEWSATFELLQRVKARLDAEHRPQGYSVGWNTGTVGGQTVFHAHLHVIPRFADEPYAGRGIRYWLKSEGNRRRR